MAKKIKAVSLISGGLDSILAVKVLAEQEIEVTGVYFTSPFWSNSEKEENLIKKIAEENNIKIKIIPVGEEYLNIIKKPQFGLGKHLNPCIDCKIFMLKKARELMEKIKARFVATGEVLGQRPMSQHKTAMNTIEKHSGLKGYLVRPLSAGLLDPTEPEITGILDRKKLLTISGRTRKNQYELAKKYNISFYSSPAGGCLLTEKNFAKKLKDLFENKANVTMHDVEILKYGRHYRFYNNKIIVGRNKNENEMLLKLKKENDFIFEVPDIGSPDTILQGDKSDDAIIFASKLTALHSDCNDNKVIVKYGKKKLDNEIKVTSISKEEADKYNISLI